MNILFLDDHPERHKCMVRNCVGMNLTQVWTASQAIETMKTNEFDLIMLDHDLDAAKENQVLDNEEDGRFVARWMAENGTHSKTTVVIHSLNIAGRNLMESILRSGGFEDVTQLPFAWQLIEKSAGGAHFLTCPRKSSLNDS